jgi:hypothetical protein
VRKKREIYFKMAVIVNSHNPIYEETNHHLPARIYGIFGGKKIGSDELRTQLRTHKKAR